MEEKKRPGDGLEGDDSESAKQSGRYGSAGLEEADWQATADRQRRLQRQTKADRMVRLDELVVSSGEAQAGREVKAPSVGTRLLRSVNWNSKQFAVDDEGSCRAWYTCHYPDIAASSQVRHRLWTVGYRREPRVALVLCPRALPGDVLIQVATMKLFVTRGDGYLAPLFWNERDWQKYLPRVTKCITEYIDPYYMDPRWWEDSGEVPGADESEKMMQQWAAYKVHGHVEPEYRIRFDRLTQERGLE